MPSFKVSVVPFEKEGSNIRGLARVYFDDCFVVSNINILQGKEKVFVTVKKLQCYNYVGSPTT